MAALLFSAIILYTYQIQTVRSQLNQYEMDTGDDGSDIWRSTSDFVPVQSQEYGDIRIGEV